MGRRHETVLRRPRSGPGRPPQRAEKRADLIERTLADLERLRPLEERAEEDLRRAERLPVWVPTPYEEEFLPGLRLAGVADRSRTVLQNQADLHIHTQWSDGDDLDRVLEAAETLGLDAIAITDHDEIAGALEARRRVHARRLRVAVVPGVEVSSREGHIGALFVTRPIPAGLSAEETVARIHEAGGLAVAHHPFAPRIIERLLRVRLGVGERILDVPFDAIECTNAVPGFATRYNIAVRDALAASRVRVAMTGSSDAHAAWQVGKGRTYYGGNHGVSSLRDAIEQGFAVGAEGYWKFREKIRYRRALVKAVFRNLLGGRRNSVAG